MTALIIKNTAFSLALIVLIGGLSQCSQSAYAASAHESSGQTLAGRNTHKAHNRPCGFFCAFFPPMRVLWQGLEGTLSSVPVFLVYRSANPSKSCRLHLAVSGKTPDTHKESHHD